MASLFAKKMKVGTRQEKQLSAVESRRTFKKYKSSPRRKIRTVSSPNTSRLPAPRRKSGKLYTWGCRFLPISHHMTLHQSPTVLSQQQLLQPGNHQVARKEVKYWPTQELRKCSVYLRNNPQLNCSSTSHHIGYISLSITDWVTCKSYISQEHTEQLVHKTKSCMPEDQRADDIITRPLPESPPVSQFSGTLMHMMTKIFNVLFSHQMWTV